MNPTNSNHYVGPFKSPNLVVPFAPLFGTFRVSHAPRTSAFALSDIPANYSSRDPPAPFEHVVLRLGPGLLCHISIKYPIINDPSVTDSLSRFIRPSRINLSKLPSQEEPCDASLGLSPSNSSPLVQYCGHY